MSLGNRAGPVAMALAAQPPADFTAVNKTAFTDLGVRQASFCPGPMATAAGRGLPGGTFARTGTAKYGTSKPFKIDAWLAGFKGDIAFACLVVNSTGDGGPTCGPIVANSWCSWCWPT